MKKIFKTSLLVFFYLQNTLTISQVIFPKELDKSFINKVICEQRRFRDKVGYGYKKIISESSLSDRNLNFKINISSDDGIYIDIENEKGSVTTQKIKTFPVWKTNIEPLYDKYGDFLRTKKEIFYKVYTEGNHDTDFCSDCIKSITYSEIIGGKYKGGFTIDVSVYRGKGLENQEFSFVLSDIDNNKVCETLKTKAEILQNELIEKQQNDLIEKNNQIVNSFLSKNKIDSAIDFYIKSGANKTHLEVIKKYLSDNKNTPSKFLSEAELFELLSEKKDLLYKIKNANLKLNIMDNGLAQLKKEDKVIETFNVDDKYIIYNNYKNIRYPVKVTYDLKIEMDTTKKDIHTIVLSDKYECIDKKNFFDKRVKFYSMLDKKNRSVIGYHDWAYLLFNTNNGEDTVKCFERLSKKYHNIHTIKNVTFNNQLRYDEVQYYLSYKFKVNDKVFPEYVFLDKTIKNEFPQWLGLDFFGLLNGETNQTGLDSVLYYCK